MPAQHIAGMPVEEILLAALAAATPMIALIGWEIRDRLRRLRGKLSRTPADLSHADANRTTAEATADPAPEVR
ncbi:hypothetical protein GCM10009554_21610 [Kribbella koreensis]|uniref:Uncharacterized protein n=1 Tax=Kribbella koreensis TaxID=57909 RepID=A0ABN1PZR3_9ACTN